MASSKEVSILIKLGYDRDFAESLSYGAAFELIQRENKGQMNLRFSGDLADELHAIDMINSWKNSDVIRMIWNEGVEIKLDRPIKSNIGSKYKEVTVYSPCIVYQITNNFLHVIDVKAVVGNDVSSTRIGLCLRITHENALEINSSGKLKKNIVDQLEYNDFLKRDLFHFASNVFIHGLNENVAKSKKTEIDEPENPAIGCIVLTTIAYFVYRIIKYFFFT